METVEVYQTEADEQLANIDTQGQDSETNTAEQIDREHEHYGNIIRLQAECDRLERDYETQNLLAKDAKKKLELAIDHLRGVIRRGPNPQGEFDFSEGQSGEATDSTVGDLSHDALMGYPIAAVIGCTAKQQDMLESAGVLTVADFERVRGGQNRDYPGGLSDLPGVGQKTIDKWEDAVIEWLKQG